MKRIWKIALCAMMAAAPAMQPALAAEGHAHEAKAEAVAASKAAPKATTAQAARERARIMDEAVTALNDTQAALRALESGKKQKALDLLAAAVGKLEVVTTAHPDLSLAPVDVDVIVRAYPGDVKAIEKAVDAAGDMLDDGLVQDARHLLDSLASEVDVRVTNIPLATYPEAIKGVVPLIEKGKTQDAIQRLQQTLATLVVVDHITPLPVLHARELLAHARKVVGKQKSMGKKDSESVRGLLKQARTELERARALGYLDKKAYRAMLKDVRSLEKKLAEHGDTRGLLDSLKQKVDDFLKSLK